MEKAARKLIKDYIGGSKYEDLWDACSREPSDIAVGKSTLSYLLQIESRDCENPRVRLLDSALAVKEIKAVLEVNDHKGRAFFVKWALGKPVLGTLLGNTFEMQVLRGLCGKGQKSRMLKLRPLPNGEEATVKVPNQKAEIQVLSAAADIVALQAGFIYSPQSRNFPGTDLYFLVGTTLWLLQPTSGKTHLCKIGKALRLLRRHFTPETLTKIKNIGWVVMVPSETIADSYQHLQKVEGEWKVGQKTVKVNQYVCVWAQP